MKKTIKTAEISRPTKFSQFTWHQFWLDNRLIFWLFVLVVVAFCISLAWNKVLIATALQENLTTHNDLAVKDLYTPSNTSAKVSGQVAQESEFISLNEAQKNFDELTFLTSPNGQSIAYIVNDEKIGKKTVALNGNTGASYDDIIFMKFSPSGQRFAYGAKAGNKSFVVLDGKEGKTYDWIFEPRFFTPDNQYFVYKARNDQGDILVFNNWETQPYDRIYGVTVNNSQNQLIFYARKGDAIWRGVVNLNKPLEANLNLTSISQ